MNSTLKAFEAPVKERLRSDADVAKWALLRVYQHQTDSEKLTGQNAEFNGTGFTKFDSEILTSFSLQLMDRGFLSYRQMAILHKLLAKYWRQILEELNPEELARFVDGGVIPQRLANPVPTTAWR